MDTYSRKQLVSKALKLFSDNYQSNFRGNDFKERYKIEFDKKTTSFRITWYENLSGENYRYDIDLFLGFSEPQATETKLSKVIEQSKILK